MCFITAGMGGGTGTGGAPIIAEAARGLGVLTVGVVTKPFVFEGPRRMRQAEEGIEALQKVVDTLIIIPNQNLFRLASMDTSITEAFQMADDVLYLGVKGVTDLMVKPGLINLDFADVRSVMDEMGKAMMGTGEATTEEFPDARAKTAAQAAIANPLLDEMSLKSAKGVLINVTGGPDMKLMELDEAANTIRENVDGDANIIVGSTIDPEMEGRMRVSVVATGIDASEVEVAQPMPRRKLAEPIRPAARREADGRRGARARLRRAPRALRARAAPGASGTAAREPAPRGPAAPRRASRRGPGRCGPRELGARRRAPAPADAGRRRPAAPRLHAAPGAGLRAARRDGIRGRAPGPARRPIAGSPTPTPGSAPSRAASWPPRAPSVRTPPPADRAARIQQAAARAGGRPVGGAPQRPAETPVERGRRSLNGLIGRMTGHAAPEPDPRFAPTPRRPVAVETPPEPTPPEASRAEESPEADRIEIPAFLRRQAN